MKTKYLLLGAIFAVFGLTAHAQMYEMYFQGFESGETVNYSGTPSANVRYSSAIHSGGSRALKLVQTTTTDVEFVLDTIDFTMNTTLRYIALHFDHICRIGKNSGTDFNMGTIWYKRANQTEWTACSSQEYNVTGSYSTDFGLTGSFVQNSYSDWWNLNEPNVSNDQWRSERFDLDNVMTSQVPANERKLLIKFVLHYRTAECELPFDTNKVAWWIDNLKVVASAERMVTPKISMIEYPTIEAYPNSRGAHIELLATTSVSAGINSDSVYLVYTGGSDPTQHRLSMTQVPGAPNHYECRIPFYGYDTLMRFYCVARDATGNANIVTFPRTVDTWVQYRCVRGNTVQPGVATPQFTGNSSTVSFPFPWDADHRCEFVYDSATLAAAGYGRGAITALRYTVAGSGVDAVRNYPRLQISMKNVPTNYVVAPPPGTYDYKFTLEGMQAVYDSAFTIPVMPSNLEHTVTLQDTFFYAGNDIVMQMTYNCSSDFANSVAVKTIPTAPNKVTMYFENASQDYGYNPFVAEDFETASLTATQRPAFVFTETSLQPLLYDAGISELVDPSYDIPMMDNPDSITVKLKNYGDRPLNAVRISYNIDETLDGYYDWSGNLAGGQETNVLIATNVALTAGFHTLRVWVEDTVTSAGQQYRDHEPYNDTIFSQFGVCAGPMNGVRNIGGTAAHFNSIEEFLFSLSRCGIDDSLIVRLAPGQYPAFTMPTVPGLSAQNYIVFESMGNSPSTLYSDSTLGVDAIVNLEAAHHVHFRNIAFVRENGPLTDMVTLGINSTDCRFEKCSFTDQLNNPVASLRINALINTGYADGLMVDSCTFNGGNIAVNAKGAAPDDYSEVVIVRGNSFVNQYSSAVKVEYMAEVTVTGNQINDVISNASYALLLNGCSGVISVENNKIYTSHGAGALALSDVTGTTAQHALVANNMIECNDDGTANQLTTPLNIIQGNWVDVVYNTVKLVAPTRGNVAAATFGGGVLNNSRFMNNIVASLDNVNYSLSYLPLSSTTLAVAHNVYYSNGPQLNRKASTPCATLAVWQSVMPEDSLSVSVNPSFVGSGFVDLRTYNRIIKGAGTPVATVPVDMFGNARGDSATCPGAFEFSSLPFDFEIDALLNPETETCYMPAAAELVVRLRNSGIGIYDSTSTNMLHLSCRVNNGPVHTMNVNQTVPADDTVTVHTGHMLSLPPSGVQTATYTLRVWCSFAGDPNSTNDTSVYTIISRYHPNAPTDIIDLIPYSSIDTITPTAGINMWAVYNSTGAPQRPSQIYWYNDSSDTEPFFVGPTYITDVLQDDAEFYIRQQRDMPIVRITQVELLRNNTAMGLTSPMPMWMVSSRKAAVQLTNVGDATAYLEGDTLMTVSPTAGLNNKVYTFGNVKIEPGQSLVVQYVSAGVTDSSVTLRNGLTPTFAYNSKVAFVYKHNGIVEDAIPLNDVTTTASNESVKWSTLGVPSYVWSGTSFSIPNNTSAGIIRTGFNGNVGDWELSSTTMPMFLDRIDSSWIRYVDYGCEGDLGHVTVAIMAPPMVDIDVSAPVLPESGCGLGNEAITVTVKNYGFDTVSNVVMNYCAGGDTVTETITGDFMPRSETTFTFSTPLNLAFPTDSTITLRVWANAFTDDPVHTNDTSVVVITSLYTPAAPAAIADRVVPYATCDTISDSAASGVIPVWYDYNMEAVDTGYTSISELLYGSGTRAMAYMVYKQTEGQIGAGVTTNANTAFPSPYQSSSKFVKQQYLYSAHELRAAGLDMGDIMSLSFYLDTMVGATSSITYQNYSIALGATSDTIFANTSDWKDASSVVFHRDSYTLTQNDDHAWVTHAFDAPYAWDGESTVVVQVSYELSAAVSTGIKTCYTSKANTTLHKNQNSALSPSTAGYIGAATSKGGNRPNIKFSTNKYGCIGPMTLYNVTLSGMPQHDASIFWADGFDTLIYSTCDTIALPLKVRNQGSETIDTMVFHYYLDDMAVDSTVAIGTYASGQLYDVALINRPLPPGRHTVTAVVYTRGDSIASNDTVRGNFMVRFCTGNYSIAANDPTADYQTFSAAIDTLNQVGVVGPVSFLVSPGTYTEQLMLTDILGSSPANTISFIGLADSVLLTASTSNGSNYVMMLDGASNIRIQNIMMEARPTANNVNYANVLVMQNNNNIGIYDSYFKVKGTIVNTNASCIVLQGNVSQLTITGTVTDSGYYAFRTAGAERNYSDFNIHDNTFRDFASGGLYIRDISRLYIAHNTIRSGNSADNRGLIGLYLAETTDSLVIQKNAIYLVDERKGAKRGIQLEQVTGTALNPVVVVNNMISTHGTNSQSLTPAKSAGIWIDSLSTYVNVLFNSVRVCGSNVNASSTASQLNTANDLSYAFWCGSSPTQISVMNNILSNFSYGYAYFITQGSSISTSNYNAYFTNAAKKFAWNGVLNIATLSGLQMQSSTDGNSVHEEPFFSANDDLHLTMTNFAGDAQYNTDVIDDIDGNNRPQIPGPTIGAHELEREYHDMAVVRIHKPLLPVSILNPNNVETDSVCVVASFNNNGLSNETGVQWFAYIEGYESTTHSVTRNLGSFTPSQMKTDSVMVPTFLGITDTHVIHVVVIANNDMVPENNEMNNTFFLAPAFNLSAENMEATSSAQPANCSMYHTQIRIKVKNSGSKAFPAGTSFKIGYHTELTSPNNVTVPTLPDTVEQMVTLDNMLPIGSELYFTFDSLANLYPTNNFVNIKVRIRGWVNYVYDVTPANDTTSLNTSKSPIKDSYYSPAPPMGHDTTFAYGTWGEVLADQENNRPIRWYRDSTAAPFYSPAQYNSSRKWSNTPQYFHDSVYYLNALSDKGCPSYFSTVNVSVMPRKTRDVAVEEMLAPLGSRVYMENDTVRVRIANYGTTTQSNFPITYRLKRGNTVVQTVTDTVTASLASTDTYEFTFKTLLDITTPTATQNYSLSVWTDLTNDATRRNDTLRVAHTFTSLNPERYTQFDSDYPSADNTNFDITRVSFNGIDVEMPPLNRAYTNLADYNNPEYPVLHVTRGTTDSIIVQISPLDATAQRFRCRGTVAIDFDRDGYFTSGPCNEILINAVPFYSDSLLTAVISIPSCASLGYMRMRVKVMGYAAESTDGHIIDFLLFVDEQAPDYDLAITQVVTPRNYLIRDTLPKVVTLRLTNRGSSIITDADINYRFTGDTIDSTASGVVHWTGSLGPGHSDVVSLPAHVFPLGTSSLAVWHNMPGDADSTNNRLDYEYHRFHTVRLVLNDNFDDRNLWYAPTGYNEFSRNFWQRGMPHKARLDTTYSGSYAWVTDTANSIVTGKRGSVSYLYSPIIDNSQIHPDTIFFRLRRNLTAGSSLRLEYYNFAGQWANLACDTVLTWYNDIENGQFTGTSSNSEGYAQYSISTTSTRITGEFPQNLQFRFVYSTPMGGSTTSAFSEGCAIDDFCVGRARRPVDAGIVAITKPVGPRFGETVYPEVVVKNYGLDTLRSVRIGYTHYGSYLAKYTDITCLVPPNERDTFEFDVPFIITSDYPDTFYITAFTIRSDDLFHDNDTMTASFVMAPLDNDISAESFVAPLSNVVAGDTAVNVTLRIRNAGYNPISHATATYLINGYSRVDEEIDFEQLLGRPLASLEYYNYTFHRKITAPMGIMHLTAFIKSPVNDYIYNDTVTKRVEGIMSITDIAAASILVDTVSDHLVTNFCLIIDNVGARGVNNFEVGYWIDNDTTTMVRETYYRAQPLAALNSGYYRFNATLPTRSSGYNVVNAFVHAEGDNDPSNDTTNVLAAPHFDVEVIKVQVEENASESCRVFVEMQNIGNASIVGQQLTARAVINGGDSIKTSVQRPIQPGEVFHVELNRRIPKSPIRQYVGTGWISPISGDNNRANDQTSIIEVINYFEGTPTVNRDQFVLEQNYPNPFSQQTTIPFAIPNAANVRFFVMDAMGHIVHRIDKFYQAGSHMITVDMESYAAGIYYYGIEVDGQRQMRKMILR